MRMRAIWTERMTSIPDDLDVCPFRAEGMG
jgi:hypothetical protein